MFEEEIVRFYASDGGVDLVGAPVVVDGQDCTGVQLAAANLAKDLGRVTSQPPSPLLTVDPETEIGDNFLQHDARNIIIIGTITSSRIIQALAEDGKVDVERIRGGWESFITNVVSAPLLSCDKALVIAGSDKRGAIFGAYTLSEQIGVSPWYWWADVPPKQRQLIEAIPKPTFLGEPSIRYRGIFLNDEAPALTGWVLENYGKYDSKFYERVFELLLRLKANFLWPAMWPGYPNPGASFFTDDPDTQRLADEYGIVVSTSHHEPMQRLSNEWFADNPDGSWNWLTNKDKITKFFTDGAERARGYESYFTLGMRGEYDKKMDGDDPLSVVQDVINCQRQVFKNIHGQEDAVPQLFAIYKEVQSLFETGRLKVPEDVTLLFQDDNFGTIRRLPTIAESKRKGGAGVYYHLEYVGYPRSYKWINSNSLGKTWHQLLQAYHNNARQIWIFNVGDLKPLEVPISFVMALAWKVDSIPLGKLDVFFEALANREFGPDMAKDVGQAWRDYDRLASLRKHEHIEPNTFSILNYNEAENILDGWRCLLNVSRSIHDRIGPDHEAASLQLILHPVKASYIYVALQIMRNRNQLWARQRRNSANTAAKEILELFDSDYDLSEEFHGLLNGKWSHMMAQPHYGYEETWHAPSRDMISGLAYVQQRQNSNPIVGQMGVAVEGHEGVRPGRINEESERTHPSRRDLVPGLTFQAMSRYGPEKRWFEIFTRGRPVIHWSASAPYHWMHLSIMEGTMVPGEEDARVEVRIDWDQVPPELDEETFIVIQSEQGDLEHLHLPVTGRQVPRAFSHGFVEASGFVSIPGTACDIPSGYITLHDTGRLATGSVGVDPQFKFTQETPYLEYPFYLFSSSPSAIWLWFGMTLDFSPENPMFYDLQLDRNAVTSFKLQESSPQSLQDAAEKGWPSAHGWFLAASDNVWLRKHQLPGINELKPGSHTIRIRLRHPNILLEKIVVDTGGTRTSYLGPPPSFRVL